VTVQFEITKIADQSLVKWRVIAITHDTGNKWIYSRRCESISMNVWTAITACLNTMNENGWIRKEE